MAAVNMDLRAFEAHMETEGKPLLVEFWAPWCVYCRRIGPAYDKVAKEMEDRLTVAKVNVDEEADLATRERIEVLPTLVLYRDGKALGSIVAPESKAKIDEFIRSYLGE